MDERIAGKVPLILKPNPNPDLTVSQLCRYGRLPFGGVLHTGLLYWTRSISGLPSLATQA